MLLQIFACALHAAGQPAAARRARDSVSGFLEALPDADARRGWEAETRGDLRGAADGYEAALAAGAPAWVRWRAAAVAVALGRTGEAIAHLEVLAEGDAGGLAEVLLGACLLREEEPDRAAVRLGMAIEILLHDDSEADMYAAPHDNSTVMPVVRDVHAAARLLQQGRYVRASESLAHAAAQVDALLSAHGTWVVARRNTDPAPVLEALVSQARLADAILRAQARTQLAEHLAEALRARGLREDLAAWATTAGHVDGLLKNQMASLLAALEGRPNHAEGWLRVGLLARATGQLPRAVHAFRTVLRICPHHGAAAARLAATLVCMGRTGEAVDALVAAERVDVATLRRHHALAVASSDAQRFERTVSRLEGSAVAGAEVRGNLAFALAMMGALDVALREWREVGV